MSNYPEMTGSEKQITWANEIREAAMVRFAESMERYVEYQKATIASSSKYIAAGDADEYDVLDFDTATAALAATSPAVEAILACADAKWWIDNRGAIASATRVHASPTEFGSLVEVAPEMVEVVEVAVAEAVSPKQADLQRRAKSHGYDNALIEIESMLTAPNTSLGGPLTPQTERALRLIMNAMQGKAERMAGHYGVSVTEELPTIPHA